MGQQVILNQNKKQDIWVTKATIPPYEEYIEAIKPLWDSYRITNMGRYHNELEEKLREYLDVEKLSLMVNGHMALELAIQMFDFPEGSEVITTPFTFISTTHAILRNRLTPVFCDVKLSDGTIDETKIEKLITEKTVAIVAVHVYGNVCNVDEIKKIAERYGLKLIYDAAHAFGVKYNGRGIGNYGDVSIFSFHATKVYNTIEGGAVAFSDQGIYDKLYNLKNFGIYDEELVVGVGANAKMNEFAAIMGLCNLKHIDTVLSERKKRYDIYMNEISKLENIFFFKRNSKATYNYAYFPIIVGDDYGRNRDQLYDFLKEKGINCRKYFYPLTADQPCFMHKYERDELFNARAIASRVLTLPLYDTLEKERIEEIVDLLFESK